MGWRDELEAARKDQTSSARPSENPPGLVRDGGLSEAELAEAELAEGFVQTTSSVADDLSVHPPVPIPALRPRQTSSTTNQTRIRAEGVPLWIDRMIVALVILLAAIVFKVLLGI
jgi:ubiquitin-conjugating enzyme E2 J1